jgi:WD40 repeat protein
VIAPVRIPGEEKELPGEIPLAYDAKTERLWLWVEAGELRARAIANLENVVRVPWQNVPGETLLDPPNAVPEAGLAWTALTDGSLVIHRLNDGRRVAHHGGLGLRRFWAAAMSPDGKRFVWGGLSRELFMLDLGTGRKTSLQGHYYDVSAISFSPDGKFFLSGGTDGLLIAWDAATGNQLWQLGSHTTSVGRIVFSPDGRVVLSHEEGVGIHLWHPATLREVGFLDTKEDAGIDQWLGLSPDGRWLAFRQENGVVGVFPVARPDGSLP